jgi:hypothetical protein
VFHGEARSSVVDGITCAFDGDARLSTSTVAGHCAILTRAIFSPPRLGRVFERDVRLRFPISFNAINAKVLFIYCPLRGAFVSAGSSHCLIFLYRPENHRAFAHKVASVKSIRSVIRFADPLSPSHVRNTCGVNAQFQKLFCTAEEIALQRDDTMTACNTSMTDRTPRPRL